MFAEYFWIISKLFQNSCDKSENVRTCFQTEYYTAFYWKAIKCMNKFAFHIFSIMFVFTPRPIRLVRFGPAKTVPAEYQFRRYSINSLSLYLMRVCRLCFLMNILLLCYIENIGFYPCFRRPKYTPICHSTILNISVWSKHLVLTFTAPIYDSSFWYNLFFNNNYIFVFFWIHVTVCIMHRGSFFVKVHMLTHFFAFHYFFHNKYCNTYLEYNNLIQ